MEEKQWRNLMLQSMSLLIFCLLLSVRFSGEVFREPDVMKVKAEIHPDAAARSDAQPTAAAVRLPEEALPAEPAVPDKVLVLDAGHGGNDEGAWDQTGKRVEKDYNMMIVHLLKERFDQTEGIQVYYTRTEDKLISKKKRVKLAHDKQADALVSIHCNASDPGDNSSHGLETLYSKQKTNSALSNKKLAETILDQLSEITGRRNRGTIQREELYLMHHSKVPTTIVEIGYMTNHSDMKYLDSKKGQEKIADGIYQGIIKALEGDPQ